jgi:hypothetical protein
LLEGDLLVSFDEAALFAEITSAAIVPIRHVLDLRIFIPLTTARFSALSV